MMVVNDLNSRSSTPHGPNNPNNTMALEDRFEVLKEIGDGSFGSVALARVRTAGASVARRGTVIAIKTMKKKFETFARCQELREVVFLQTLPAHPHLVPALEIFLDPFSKKLHIAMEYMEGNLYQLMKARDHKCLDNSSVKSILFQIMQGLEHIHAHHFFHRDIKPENILVSTSSHQDSVNSFRRYSALVTPPSTPPTYTVKIADFGLARETHSRLPYTTYVSTRWYRAPEVLLRAGEYSAPVDIWAVGAMAVEVATLKPLFPGGNEVDQVWRVCEIMGSPGNWFNKTNARVGGGEWREGTRLAQKLGFSFPKMAPHAIDTILQSPQWPASLSQFVTWCLMWDPKNRPTSSQALAHEYFTDAVDPLRPKSSASRMLGRKQSDISHRSSTKDSVGPTLTSSSKPSWFRKSLIGRSDNSANVSSTSGSLTNPNATNGTGVNPEPTPQPTPQPTAAHRPPPVHASTTNEITSSKVRPSPGAKRATWTNGQSNAAPMPILPTIRPISPIYDAATAQGSSQRPDEKKKLGRQLSVNSSTNHYADIHRQEAERALNGKTGLQSPPSAHKESFFSHLRKRARRFSGRNQTPVSPNYEDIEAQVGCGPWASNRSSMIIDSQPVPVAKMETYESIDKALRPAHANLDSSPQGPTPPAHQVTPSNNLKRHHSLPHHQPRSVDNLMQAARTGPISSRTRRAQAAQGMNAPSEEDELLDEELSSTYKPLQRLDKDGKPALRQSASNVGFSNPYPTPSPSANGNTVLFGDGNQSLTPKPLNYDKKPVDSQYKWPTPPYEESEWAASASASIWAASNRF